MAKTWQRSTSHLASDKLSKAKEDSMNKSKYKEKAHRRRNLLTGAGMVLLAGLMLSCSNPMNSDSNNNDNNSGTDEPDLIAFVSERDGNQEIYRIDSNGGNLTQLTDNSANDYSPAFS